MSDHNNTKGFLTGLLAGAAVGSIFALLYAPEKGSDTRDRVSYRLKAIIDELDILASKISQESDVFLSDAKDKGEKVVVDAQQRAEDLIKDAEDLLKKINEEEQPEAKG